MSTLDYILNGNNTAGQSSKSPAAEQREQQAESTPTMPASETTDATGEQPVSQATPERLSYVDIYKKLNPYTPPSEKDIADEKKKQQREQMFSAIGDGISSLANLFFTAKYAPNMHPGPVLSENSRVRYGKLKKERESNLNAYYNGLQRAMRADDSNAQAERAWQRTLGIEEKKKRDDDYRKERDKIKDAQWQQAFEEKQRRAEESHNFAVQKHNATQEYRKKQLTAKKSGSGRTASGRGFSINPKDTAVAFIPASKDEEGAIDIGNGVYARPISYDKRAKKQIAAMAARDKDFVKENPDLFEKKELKNERGRPTGKFEYKLKDEESAIGLYLDGEEKRKQQRAEKEAKMQEQVRTPSGRGAYAGKQISNEELERLPQSERVKYFDANTWMPESYQDYLNKKEAEKEALKNKYRKK
jgi:hypothetical protein